MADLRPERPNLRPEGSGLRHENLGLRRERPNLRREKPNLRPERLDLRPEKPDLRPEGPDEGGTNGRTNGVVNRPVLTFDYYQILSASRFLHCSTAIQFSLQSGI